MSAITLDNVSKRYGDVHALRPLSVEFPSGKLSTIFGKSGSGKTTLLSVIAGLLKPTTGAIWYQDKNIATLTKDECAALRRTDIGVVFQDHNIINELTVLENVRLPLEANGMSRTAAITASEQTLAKVSIGHLGRRFPAEISGGSGSGWVSPGLSRAPEPCCSPTSPAARSTAKTPQNSSNCFTNSPKRAAQCCASPTTRWRFNIPTRCSAWTPGSSAQSATTTFPKPTIF